MRRWLSVVLVLIGSVTAGASAGADRPSEHPEVAGQTRVLEAWIERQMKDKALPGMSVGLVYDGDLIYARGFGFSDLASRSSATAQTALLRRISSRQQRRKT